MRQTCIAQIAKPAVMSSSLYSAKQVKKKKLKAVLKRGESGAMALRNTTPHLYFFPSRRNQSKNCRQTYDLCFHAQQPSSKATNDGWPLTLHVQSRKLARLQLFHPPHAAHSTDVTHLRHNLENSGKGEREKRKYNRTEARGQLFPKSVPGSSVPRLHIITPPPFRRRSP